MVSPTGGGVGLYLGRDCVQRCCAQNVPGRTEQDASERLLHRYACTPPFESQLGFVGHDKEYVAMPAGICFEAFDRVPGILNRGRKLHVSHDRVNGVVYADRAD